GKDVTILQNLLLRSKYVDPIGTSGAYDKPTSKAVAQFQQGNKLNSTPGVFDIATASLVLKQLMYDGYHDDGTIPKGYKFKLYIPVYADRTKETNATLYDNQHKPIYTFIVRCHGSMDLETGMAVNQLTTNGNTPTGLMSFDLNSPEPNHKSFGPFPVVRAVEGIKGNAAIGRDAENTFLPYYRDGLLLHTGEWANWNASMPMPNSNGCIHAHPADLKRVDDILTHDLGVAVRPNPFKGISYPYKPQGLLSIEQLDGRIKS
ncbi:predicted protein, partial [Nematostella vectensis]